MKRVISVLCAVFFVALAAPSADAQPSKSKASSAKKTKKAKKSAAKKSPRTKTSSKKSARSTAKKCPKGQKRVDGQCTRDVDFLKGDSIDGDTPNGYGEHLTARGNADFGGLIRLRTNFHAEILKSATDL